MKYKVLRDGIKQRSGEKWKKVKKGDLIDLSPSAAYYFVSEGFVEDATAVRPKSTIKDFSKVAKEEAK